MNFCYVKSANVHSIVIVRWKQSLLKAKIVQEKLLLENWVTHAVPKDNAIQIKRILNDTGCRSSSSQYILFGRQIVILFNSVQVTQITIKNKVHATIIARLENKQDKDNKLIRSIRN